MKWLNAWLAKYADARLQRDNEDLRHEVKQSRSDNKIMELERALFLSVIERHQRRIEREISAESKAIAINEGHHVA